MHFIPWFIVFATIDIYVCVIMPVCLWSLYLWIDYKCDQAGWITKVYWLFYSSNIQFINVIGEWLTICFLYVMSLYTCLLYTSDAADEA